MGFKSFFRKLGKVASVAAPFVAAPFTGGASLAAVGAGAGAVQTLGKLGKLRNIVGKALPYVSAGSNLIGDLGTTASGAAEGSATQRRNEADAVTSRYAQSLQGARDQSSADLKAAQFTRGEDSRAFERALIANQMERGPLTMGASTSDAFTPTAPSYQNAPGAANAALLAQLAPLDRIATPTYTLPLAPGVNAQGIPLDLVQGRGEKILGGVGLAAKLAQPFFRNLGGDDSPPRPLDFDRPSTGVDWSKLPGAGEGPVPLPPPRPLGFDRPSTGVNWAMLPGAGEGPVPLPPPTRTADVQNVAPVAPDAQAPAVPPPGGSPVIDRGKELVSQYPGGSLTNQYELQKRQALATGVSGPQAATRTTSPVPVPPPGDSIGASPFPRPTPNRPPLDILYGNMRRGSSVLDAMPTLSEDEKLALSGSQQIVNLLAMGALTAPVLGLGAEALAMALVPTLLRVNPVFIAKSTGAAALAERANLEKILGMVKGSAARLVPKVPSYEEAAARLRDPKDTALRALDTLRQLNKRIGKLTPRELVNKDRLRVSQSNALVRELGGR